MNTLGAEGPLYNKYIMYRHMRIEANMQRPLELDSGNVEDVDEL